MPVSDLNTVIIPHCCQSGCLSNVPFLPQPNSLKNEILLFRNNGSRNNAIFKMANGIYLFGYLIMVNETNNYSMKLADKHKGVQIVGISFYSF